LLGNQSGESQSTDRVRKNNRPVSHAFGEYRPDETGGFDDSGTASRFFKQIEEFKEGETCEKP
jgi:hypothetical protein